MTLAPHRWQFFRAGGFDQALLQSPADLAALPTLDQKLWAALACPVAGLEFDRRTLEYLDSDHDGRIRAPELLAAVQWTLARLADPGVLFGTGPLPLAALRDDAQGQPLRAAARRLLAQCGRDEGAGLTPADTEDRARLFPPDLPNGDGMVPPALAEDEATRAVITDIIAALGAEADRSGAAAVSEAQVQDFFAQAAQVQAWLQQGATPERQPLGAATPGAMAALAVLREKIDDYFHRVALAGFDARAGVLMNGEESELVRLAARNLAQVQETAHLPLADIRHGERLPLTRGLNPAWAQAMQAFREQVVCPLLGESEVLTAAEWQALRQRCAPYFDWQAQKPALPILRTLSAERVAWMAAQGFEERLRALIARDRAAAPEAEALLDLDRLLRFSRHLVPLLNNFVAFRDFYRGEPAVFQAGTLYIDGKSCALVVRVDDVEAHSRMAGASGSFLLYCECRRRQPAAGEPETCQVVAAVTAGEEGNLMVGRNGVFYDRAGRDWDARVVKMVQNAISVREAFWLPYRRLARLVSEQVQKLAASRDQALTAQAQVALADTAPRAVAAPPGGSAGGTPRAAFDIARFAGIFAAIGLALGALGTAAATMVSSFLALHWWQMPLALLGLMLLLSGPSMVLAWFKLRRRNLAPLLDASGWAVNSQARLSIGFGSALTHTAALPPGAVRTLRDPYAPPRPLWPWVLAALLLLGLWAGWRWRGF